MTGVGEAVAVVRALFDAFGAGDQARLRELLAADVEWVQNEGFPGGATWVGPDGVLEGAFARLRTDWSDWRADVRELLDAGDAVVVLGTYRGTYCATGRAAEAEFAHVYRVRGGRVHRFEQYTDTHSLVRATRTQAQASGNLTTE